MRVRKYRRPRRGIILPHDRHRSRILRPALEAEAKDVRILLPEPLDAPLVVPSEIRDPPRVIIICVLARAVDVVAVEVVRVQQGLSALCDQRHAVVDAAAGAGWSDASLARPVRLLWLGRFRRRAELGRGGPGPAAAAVGRGRIWGDGLLVGCQTRRGVAAVGVVVYDDHALFLCCGFGVGGAFTVGFGCCLVVVVMVGLWGERALRVEVQVHALAGFAGRGGDLVPVLRAEGRDVRVESPLDATFGIGAEMICMRHGAGVNKIEWEPE